MAPASRYPLLLLACALLPGLAGCDLIKQRAGIPDPVRIEAEGKAIGGACRHAGRGLEDCFRLNPDASKPAMFQGWREMNEYMIKQNMQPMPPTVPLAAEAGAQKPDQPPAASAPADRPPAQPPVGAEQTR